MQNVHGWMGIILATKKEEAQWVHGMQEKSNGLKTADKGYGYTQWWENTAPVEGTGSVVQNVYG